MSRRTSWMYCPQCHRDLNGDNQSWVDNCGDLERYTCASCGFNSEWMLDAPVPIFLGSWTTAEETP